MSDLDHRRHRPPFVNLMQALPAAEISIWELRIGQANVSAISQDTLHTLEHLLQTYLEPPGLFAAPMGCGTGLYVLATTSDPVQFCNVMRAALKEMTLVTDVPNANPSQCGAYRFHDLPGAQLIGRWLLTRSADWLDPVHPEP